jgi:hypothetical protein
MAFHLQKCLFCFISSIMLGVTTLVNQFPGQHNVRQGVFYVRTTAVDKSTKREKVNLTEENTVDLYVGVKTSVIKIIL